MFLDQNLGETEGPVAAPPTDDRQLGLSDMPRVIQYLVPVLLAAMATAIAAGFDRYENIPNLSLIYVLPVVISSVAFGLGPALFAALLGALSYNFFFTEPRFSLAVADTANIWAIVLLFVVGCITSAITSTKRSKEAELESLHRCQVELQAYARRMMPSTSAVAATRLTRSVLASIFEAPVAVLLTSNDGDLAADEEVKLSDTEMEAAKTACASDTIVLGGVYPFDRSRFDFWPTQLTSDRTVVIGIAFDPQRRPLNAGATVAIVALLLGATVERCHA